MGYLAVSQQMALWLHLDLNLGALVLSLLTRNADSSGRMPSNGISAAESLRPQLPVTGWLLSRLSAVGKEGPVHRVHSLWDEEEEGSEDVTIS